MWLHGLTLRDKTKTIEGAGKGNRITNCRLTAHYTIHTPGGADSWFIADNVLRGDAGGKFSFDGEGVDFGSDKGGGHAVCFNEISDFADGVSYGGGNIDVYNNYIHETVDDFIEPDYARENYRVWENRCYNSMCGFSFQPMKGGPWYYFGNLNVGTYLHAFKAKRIDGPAVIAGNTILSKNPGLGGARAMLRGQIVNNVWMRTTPGPLTDAPGWDDAYLPTRIDYNAYSKGNEEVFAGIGYRELARRFGWDRHSASVDWRNTFTEKVKEPAGRPYYASGIEGMQIPKDWHFEHVMLIPKADSPLVDAGTVLPNLTGPHLGKAPDLGAHEVGLGTAWYGPRTWDDQAGLVYGVPEGWQKVPPAQMAERARDLAAIGCPDAADAKVLLASDSPKLYALLRAEPATGEARWEKIRKAVADDAGAATPILEFQDGLLMRLYVKAGRATVIAARVEPDAVLHATAGCAEKDLPAARTALFQFMRSLCR